MSDMPTRCPHCGYRLPGTPGRYDTCQKCKKKIVWTKGRPYKTLTDVPNESHVINPHPTRRQHPPVPSTEYEPYEESSFGFSGSMIFDYLLQSKRELRKQKARQAEAQQREREARAKAKNERRAYLGRIWKDFWILYGQFLVVSSLCLIALLFSYSIARLFWEVLKEGTLNENMDAWFIVSLFCFLVLLTLWLRRHVSQNKTSPDTVARIIAEKNLELHYSELETKKEPFQNFTRYKTNQLKAKMRRQSFFNADWQKPFSLLMFFTCILACLAFVSIFITGIVLS